jgi:hypothetical protein
MRHAKELRHLPVPHKDFIRRERMSSKMIKNISRSRVQEQPQSIKINVENFIRGDTQHQKLPKKEKECLRWMLQPMTEKPPEPKPGVPTITVTNSQGKTCWPKDLNCYISKGRVEFLTKRATRQHYGDDSEFHCALFQEYCRKGWDKKPIGHRPEVLLCTECLAKQMEIEEEEARMAFESARVSCEGADDEQDDMI